MNQKFWLKSDFKWFLRNRLISNVNEQAMSCNGRRRTTVNFSWNEWGKICQASRMLLLHNCSNYLTKNLKKKKVSLLLFCLVTNLKDSLFKNIIFQNFHNNCVVFQTKTCFASILSTTVLFHHLFLSNCWHAAMNWKRCTLSGTPLKIQKVFLYSFK